MAVPVATATTQGRSFVFYGKLTRAQFINHADDRERGKKINPFSSDILPTPPNANTGKKGARAGDNALLSVKLYSDPDLKRPVGSAIYSCTFNFGGEAICEASFELGNGTMIAMGPARLDSSAMILPVTGGTGRYRGAHGQVTSSSSRTRKNTQVIRFRLV
jgi:hypothetical protein